MSLAIVLAEGVGEGLTLADLGLDNKDLGSSESLLGVFNPETEGSVPLDSDASVVICLYWDSKVEADRICSGGLSLKGAIGVCNVASSSVVMYKVLEGDSGSSIWMMCSLLSKPGGGDRRLSLTGSKAGVLGSDGSCDEDFSGRVCSEPPSEPGKEE